MVRTAPIVVHRAVLLKLVPLVVSALPAVLSGGGVLAQELNWARQIGGSVGDERAYGIVADAAGGVSTCGTFRGTADFDPGPGTYALTSVGYDDQFVAKLDAHGTFLWAGAFPAFQPASASAIAGDDEASVYVAGSFDNDIDVDPDPSAVHTLTGGRFANDDSYVVKLDSGGHFVWAVQLACGAGGNSYVTTIRVDADHNLYVTGGFESTVDFDPDPVGVYNLTSSGSSDAFVWKLDSLGHFLWASRIGGPYDDDGRAVAVDASGNVVSVGYFSGKVDFDPGPGVYHMTAAVNVPDMFAVKLGQDGSFLWAKQMGGPQPDIAGGVTVDPTGNVYITGDFKVTADFDPDPGIVYNLTSAGSDDVFVAKLSPDGAFLWAGQLGGPNPDYGLAIALDRAGNVYTTGSAYTGDFDPGPGTFTLKSRFYDAFISKLDPEGRFLAAVNLGGPSGDSGVAITVNELGEICTAGSFEASADFAPGPGVFTLTVAGPSGSTDAFLSNLTQTPTIAFADATTIVWNNVFGEVAYNVYRSDSVLPGTFSCLASHRSEPSLDDFDEPSAGALLTYLVTTVNSGGEEGTLGFQTVAGAPTAERPNPNPCLGSLLPFQFPPPGRSDHRALVLDGH